MAAWLPAAFTFAAYAIVCRPPFSGYYWDLATGLLRTHALALPDGTRTAAFEPGYPLFVAAVRALVGDRPHAVQIVQALVAAAGAYYLGRLAEHLTGRPRVGIIAALLFALYPLLVRHAVDPTESALFTLALIAFASRFVAMQGAAGAIAAGSWLALAVLTRSIAVLVIPVAAILAARRPIRCAAIFTATALLLTAPYGWWLWIGTGTVAPARAGLNLFISNCGYAADIMPTYAPDLLVEYAERRMAAESPATDPSDEASENAAFIRMAWAEVARHPAATARLKLLNVAYLFSPVLVPSRDLASDASFTIGARGQAIPSGGRERPMPLRLAYSLSYVPILALAAAGAWRRRRDLARSDAILWVILSTFTIVYAAFFPTTRYRAPVDFVLLFYAAVAVDRWVWRRS